MMPGHDPNPILFNKKNKDWTFRTLANPPTANSQRPIKSHFCLPPTPLKVDVIYVSPLKQKRFRNMNNRKCSKTTATKKVFLEKQQRIIKMANNKM